MNTTWKYPFKYFDVFHYSYDHFNHLTDYRNCKIQEPSMTISVILHLYALNSNIP